jgi:ATP-binding cassette subfamily F protein 3
MRAKDVLLEAIAAFSGTVVFVSHDRYFIDRLATRVIEVEAGTITTYEGNYEDYLRRKEALVANSTNNMGAPGPSLLGTGDTKVLKGQDSSARQSVLKGHDFSRADNGAQINGALAPEGTAAPKKKLNPIKLKQMQERCAFLEEEVPRIESSINTTEQQLGNFISVDETQRQSNLLDSLRTQLNELTAEWEELMTQLDEQDQ